MKNIHNANIFITTEEEALKLALKIKEQVKKDNEQPKKGK
tara:strand:+ start:158 stop:277 length:120 start_codon:yes stop_codon:yes gene_type:complete